MVTGIVAFFLLLYHSSRVVFILTATPTIFNLPPLIPFIYRLLPNLTIKPPGRVKLQQLNGTPQIPVGLMFDILYLKFIERDII